MNRRKTAVLFLTLALSLALAGTAFARGGHGSVGGSRSFSRGGGFGGHSGGHGSVGGSRSFSRERASHSSRYVTGGYSRSRTGGTHYHYHDHGRSHTSGTHYHYHGCRSRISGRHYHHHLYYRPYRYRNIHWHCHEHWGWGPRYYCCRPGYYWYDSWYWPAGFTVGLILGNAVSYTPSAAANYYYNVCAEGCNCLDKYNPTPCNCTENCYCNAYHKK
ncbi:MAG: hypothetical protein Q4E34_05240 [Synergistaceae bacterium]|nr:hypothetical protein [Synergistaceae bacterium]